MMKRFLAALFTLLAFSATPYKASAQFGGCLPAFCATTTPPVTGCTEYEDFIARTTGIDNPHKVDYRDLICGLVTDGLWTKLEAFYIYATQDSTTALLNLKTPPGFFDSTAFGSPLFTVDRGFTGGVSGGNTVYINTHFGSPTGGYTQNSAHMSIWVVTAATNTAIGATDGAPEVFWDNTIAPFGSGNQLYAHINSVPVAGPHDGFAVASGVGHSLGTRTSNTNVDVYKDGVSLGSYTRASGDPTNAFFTLGYANAATAIGGPNQLAMASMGAVLNGTDVTNFYNRLRTYMTAVGVP